MPKIGRGRTLPVLTAQTVDNGIPTLASDGVAYSPGAKAPRHAVKIRMTGSGPISADFTLWVFDGSDWALLGVDPSAGQLNGGNTLSGNNLEVREEVVEDIGAFERLYVQVANSAGTAFSVDVSAREIMESAD